MITLITGTPGAGKTLYSLRFMKDLEKDYRFVYAHGITGLLIEHEIIVCESKTCDFCTKLEDYSSYKKVKNWVDYADVGSVLFIDECQHIYRNKGSMNVEVYESHRHLGVDFYMITQHPMLINTDLRRLVGRHIHLIADFLGRKQYEWVECSQSLSLTKAQKSKYLLDKSLFAIYQSSQLHTKVQRKFPLVVWIFLGAILLMLFLSYKIKTRVSSKLQPVSQSQQIQSTGNQANQVKSNSSESKIFSSAGSVSAPADYQVLLKTAKLERVNYLPSLGFVYYFVSGSQGFDSSMLVSDGYTITKKGFYAVTIKNKSGFDITVTK